MTALGIPSIVKAAAPSGISQGLIYGRLRTQIVKTIVALAAALLVAILCQLPAWQTTPTYVLVNVITTTTFVAGGIAVRSHRLYAPLSWPLIGAGFMASGQWLGTWNRGPFPFMAINANMFFYVIAGWGVANYLRSLDEHRHEHKLHARLVQGVFLSLSASVVALAATIRPAELGFSNAAWWPTLVTSIRPADAKDVYFGSQLCLAFFGVLGISLLVRNTRGLDRSTALPVGITSSVVGAVSSLTTGLQLFPATQMDRYYFISSILILLVPLGILIAVIREHLQRASVALALHVRLSQAPLTFENIRDALRLALNDHSLNVLRPSPDRDVLPECSWQKEVRDRNDIPLAIVTAGPAISRHPGVLDMAVHSSTIALENAHMHAALEERLVEVQASRARIAEAALDERRRIQRDLHDGVQQRLLAVMGMVGLVRRKSMSPGTVTNLDTASNGLRAALADLRSLAHGIHPPELEQFGLDLTIEEIAAQLPLPVDVDIQVGRLPPSIELTAYFVICESLTNVVKHAKASWASVVANQSSGVIRILIVDNGIGGAEPRAGTGLTGLQDRVDALGGELRLTSPTGVGTTIELMLPSSVSQQNETSN